uniref:TAF6 C-terminal HEAT repeat domain-containing protein n=1 Tax=Clastoptera arizonana TaxID=38151 RepID=A0A1B6CVQ6_9HEMI
MYFSFQNCIIALHNNKRQKLLTSDVTRVLEVSNSIPIYGHSTGHALEFVHIPESDVFVTNDVEVDIVKMVLSKTEYIKPTEEYVKGIWLLPDPPPEKVTEAATTSNPSTSEGTTSIKIDQHNPPQPKPTIKTDELALLSKPPPHFINYYLQVARVVIGGSEPHLKVALADLRKNPNIGPLLPYFLNLVALTVNKLQRHHRLTDALLRTIEVLVENNYIDPSPSLAVNRAANALLVIAIETNTVTHCDDLQLRKRAAVLLAKVIVSWSVEIKQQIDIVKRLLQLILDYNSSLKSHYGAIVILTVLGNKILDSYFWPIIDRYFKLLDEKEKDSAVSKLDMQCIKGAILMAVERMYRKLKYTKMSTEGMKTYQKIEKQLYEFFGDTLVPRILLKKPSYVKTNDFKQQLENDINGQHESGLKTYNPLTRISRLFLNVKKLSMYKFNTKNNYLKKLQPSQDLYSVFDIPENIQTTKDIYFNFVGSNQLNREYLHHKYLDPFQLYYTQPSRYSQLWVHQNIYKNTRCIKYCSSSHLKSKVGDLFQVL